MKTPFVGDVDMHGKLDPDVRGQVAEYIRTFAGRRIEVKVKQYRPQRSLDQNAFWWAVPVELLSEHCGYEPEQMHYALLGEWRGYMDGPRGEKVPRCCSSSKLTTLEFTELIEWVQRWAAIELNVIIPAPNEWLPEVESTSAVAGGLA